MKTECDIQAEKFLADNGLKLRITLSDSKAASWEPSGHHYRVTLSRNAPQWRGGPQDNFQPKRVVFDFWGSFNDMREGKDPEPYSVENIEQLLAEYFGVDLRKAEEERRALLDAIRADNTHPTRRK